MPALSALFVCDMQEKFRKAIWEFDKVILTTQKALKFAAALQIPVFVTTQNKARLGDTAAELAPYLEAARVEVTDDKTLFSMWTPAISARFGELGGGASAVAVAIVGIETHICVTQTALDLLAAGCRVYVLADGVSSCNSAEVGLALARLRAEGAVVTSSESWMYETMGDAAIAEFRSVAAIVKESGPDTKAVLGALFPPKM